MPLEAFIVIRSAGLTTGHVTHQDDQRSVMAQACAAGPVNVYVCVCVRKMVYCLTGNQLTLPARNLRKYLRRYYWF